MVYEEPKNPLTEKAPRHAAAANVVVEPTQQISGLPEFHFYKVVQADNAMLQSPGKLIQRKFDGTSTETFINANIRIFGRGMLKGRDSEYTKRFPELIEALKILALPHDTDFLAELVIINPTTGYEDFSLVQTRATRDSDIESYARSSPAYLLIHDVVKVDGVDVSKRGYLDRMEVLKNAIDWSASTNIFFVKNSTDGVGEWQAVEDNKLEGLVIRDPNATLGVGVWKVKREITEDAYCVGEFEPSDSVTYTNLTYKLSNGEIRRGVFKTIKCYQLTQQGKEVAIANVGGGFKESDRQMIQALLTEVRSPAKIRL